MFLQTFTSWELRAPRPAVHFRLFENGRKEHFIAIRVRISKTATTTPDALRKTAARRRRSFYVRLCEFYFFVYTSRLFLIFFAMPPVMGRTFLKALKVVLTTLYRLCRVKRAYLWSLKLGCAIDCCLRQPRGQRWTFYSRAQSAMKIFSATLQVPSTSARIWFLLFCVLILSFC